MGDLIATPHGERGAPGASEMLAAIVRELMADRRGRLALGDAPREVSVAEAATDAPRATPEAVVPAREHLTAYPARA